MDRHEWTHTALHRGLYLAINMNHLKGPHTALTIALHRGLYLTIIMDRHEGPQTTLTIACASPEQGSLPVRVIT
jgi:hypothetical protein